VKVTAGSHPQQAIAELAGNIGESSDLFKFNPVGKTELVIDFQNMGYINSVGVKNWIFWMGRMPKGLKIIYRNCNSAVITQINTVKGFLLEGSVVESFYVPYHCDACNFEEKILAKAGQDFVVKTATTPGQVNIPETRPCPKCKAEMEIDTIPAQYFKFIIT